jgi:hypothetical protein
MKAFAAFSVALLLSIPSIHLAAGLRDEFQDRRQEEGAADAYSAESNGSGPGTNTNLNEQDQILTVASIRYATNPQLQIARGIEERKNCISG